MKIKKVKFSVAVYAFLGLLVFLVIVFSTMIYGFGMENKFIFQVEKAVPFPGVIFGNGRIIRKVEVNDKLQAIKRFYENQDFSEIGLRVDFSTEDGRKRLKIKEKNLINKLIENRVVENLAKKRNIKFTDKNVSQEVSRKLSEYGDENYLKNTVLNLYGWQLADFEKNIVMPDLYREALKNSVMKTEVDFVSAKEKIDQAKKELQSGQSFEEMVKKYSTGESVNNKGYLGWFPYNQMLSEIAVAVFPLSKGETTEVVESSLGYHIIEVLDKKKENGLEMVEIRQIFVRIKSFDEWLLEQKKNINIYIPLKAYYWDKENAEVVFSEKEMQEFEEKELNNFSGDASVLF